MANWQLLHSYRNDRAVAKQKLAPGTVKRVLSFARPYRRELAVFVTLVVLDAAVSVITPLLVRRLLDDAIPNKNLGLVETIFFVYVGFQVFDAGFSLANRWYSSRIGEGLIFDLRSQVYDHVQRMPVAFFTRTQTGALVSRLNNDVIGAQQAFT